MTGKPEGIQDVAATSTLAELLEERLKIGVSLNRLITEIGWNYEKYVQVQSAINTKVYDEFRERFGIERPYSGFNWSRPDWIVAAIQSGILLELSKYEKGTMQENLLNLSAAGVFFLKDGIEAAFRETNAKLEPKEHKQEKGGLSETPPVSPDGAVTDPKWVSRYRRTH